MVDNTVKEVEKLTVNYAGRFFDERLERRGEKIMKNRVDSVPAILNQLSDISKEYVGASRFFLNESVLEEALIEESSGRCQKAATGKHVLAIQDTSEINYQKHRGKLTRRDQELGPIGNDKDIGFFIHPMLVLERENGLTEGVVDTYVWNRNWKKKNKKERNYKSQPIEEKES